MRIFFKKTFLLFLIIICGPSFAGSFDESLERISLLRDKKQFATLVTFLHKAQASKELDDLRLFLLAEAYKNIDNKSQAITTYEKLLKYHPECETAYQARLPHFLLLLENADEKMVAKLEGIARSLPTAWQRGTALEKISALEFLKPGKKSRLIFMAIKEYNSDKPFYTKVPASHQLIKKVLSEPDRYSFEDDEWLQIIKFAENENLLGDFYKKQKVAPRGFGKWGQGAFEIYRALSLANDSKSAVTADILLTRLINSGKLPPALRALAFQARAEINYRFEKYEQAAQYYRKALEYSAFPVDVRACQYRLMRCAFFNGHDSECLELLNQLVKREDAEPLLPGHIYEMGIERYDKGMMNAAVPYLMILARAFPWHYRADDALGYAAIAMGKNSKEAAALIKLLGAKYPNSFFLMWLDSAAINKKLPSGKAKNGKLPSAAKTRLKAWKKLWNTAFSEFAREEARKMTDKYPANFALYKGIIDICIKYEDYSQLVAYGERLLRQLLENGKSMSDMPGWAWRAHYPEAYMNLVRAEAKKNGIDPYWVLSIMREESHFNPKILSRSNAMGLMQILPSTGKWIAAKVGYHKFRKDHLWKPQINVKFGCWYLKYLYDMFNGDLYLASAAYNGGQGNITRKVENGPYARLDVLERLDKVPLPETRDYYKKVMGSYWNYKKLY
ncbi:MAG: hypothetical protein Kow0029_14480 [Candidatus Rifleibacteriota bacterium]